MIQSMTGFGSSESVVDGVSLAIEIRGVNHRYLKTTLKLADAFQPFEGEIDKLIRDKVRRGSITFTLKSRSTTPGNARPLNLDAIRHYVHALQQVQEGLPAQATMDLATLASLPGVCDAAEPDEAARAQRRDAMLATAGDALDRLVAMRAEEGRQLHAELKELCSRILEETDAVAERAPTVIDEYHDRLRARVEMLLKKGDYDLESEALMREVAIFADRSDIREELTRLRSHVEQFRQMMDSEEPVGRTLDFLTQEFLREANTIASKSSDAETSRRVIAIKRIIDRIKEQVQNVE